MPALNRYRLNYSRAKPITEYMDRELLDGSNFLTPVWVYESTNTPIKCDNYRANEDVCELDTDGNLLVCSGCYDALCARLGRAIDCDALGIWDHPAHPVQRYVWRGTSVPVGCPEADAIAVDGEIVLVATNDTCYIDPGDGSICYCGPCYDAIMQG
jgi:hypothetical protein